MHARQDLGESLVALSAARLGKLALPEQLVAAIDAARKITRHEARRRQMQFIGRLMREIDPEPIHRQIAQWAAGPKAATEQLHEVERWRDRLLRDDGALDDLCSVAPRADRSRLTALVARARAEREQGGPPHSFRELFRVLGTLLAERRDPA